MGIGTIARVFTLGNKPTVEIEIKADKEGVIKSGTTYAKPCLRLGGDWWSFSDMTGDLEFFMSRKNIAQP